MKRIAILGCSHSSYDEVINPVGADDNGLDWIHHMSIDNPHVEFHNYAAQGHGPLYYDFILKYILSEFPDDYYDAVIIQYTVEGRWHFPLCIENAPYVSSEEITDNYVVKRWVSSRLVGTLHHNHVQHVNSETTRKHILMAGKALYSYKDDKKTDLMYEHAFMSTLNKLYGPHFKNIFYFDFLNGYIKELNDQDHSNRTNIGVLDSFVNWARSVYGEEYLLMNILNDSMHCTSEGNQLLYHQYILNSNIGKYLKMVS